MGWMVRPPLLFPEERHPVPFAQKAGWASRLVWIMENLTPPLGFKLRSSSP